MKIPEENFCRFCDEIFCCETCRHKHEIKTHAIRIKKVLKSISSNEIVDGQFIEGYGHIFCSICENKPMPMREVMCMELLQHIEVNHLPLHCQKCSKIYYKVEDLKEFSKCSSVEAGAASKQNTGVCMALDQLKGESQNIEKLTISTQTSPMLSLDRSFNLNSTPPLSALNIQWKTTKVIQEEFISDSVSSIKNLSLISDSSSIRRSTTENLMKAPPTKNVRGKLVRSTSTPVHMEINCPKPKQQTFDASNGQVSSIYNSNSEANSSPLESAANVAANGTTTRAALETISRYRKTGARPKIASVTPLRQVMSKSIQKAIAEHGAYLNNQKQVLEANDCHSKSTSLTSSPLDLRLSPALRRCNEGFDGLKPPEKAAVHSTKPNKKIHRELVVSSTKTTTKSVVITTMEPLQDFYKRYGRDMLEHGVMKDQDKQPQASQSNSISVNSIGNSEFQTCESIEIFTSTSNESNQHNMDRKSEDDDVESRNEAADQVRPLKKCMPHINNSLGAITPITRLSGSLIGKKAIKFETPYVENPLNPSIEESPCQEVFYTPQSSPTPKVSYYKQPSEKKNAKNYEKDEKLKYPLSPSRRPPLRSYARNTDSELTSVGIEDVFDDDVFGPLLGKAESRESKPNSGYLWNLVGAVMRKGSALARLVPLGDDPEDDSKPKSILRRCASIAGSLVRSSSTGDDQLQTLKRKRTNTMDSLTTCPKDQNVISPSNDASRKRLRIQPRPPIVRMRKDS